MAKIIVNINLSLDGVMQAPGLPDEDPRGGFEHGGWAAPYADPEVSGKIIAEAMASGPGTLLFGRRTYEQFYSAWPARPENPFSQILANAHKYVASRTLREPLPWANSTLLSGDAAETVPAVKAQSPKDIVILGSGELVRSLARANLVDEYQLSIHPLVLGSGQRLFDDVPYATLKLVDSQVSRTGVIIAR